MVFANQIIAGVQNDFTAIKKREKEARKTSLAPADPLQPGRFPGWLFLFGRQFSFIVAWDFNAY